MILRYDRGGCTLKLPEFPKFPSKFELPPLLPIPRLLPGALEREFSRKVRGAASGVGDGFEIVGDYAIEIGGDTLEIGADTLEIGGDTLEIGMEPAPSRATHGPAARRIAPAASRRVPNAESVASVASATPAASVGAGVAVGVAVGGALLGCLGHRRRRQLRQRPVLRVSPLDRQPISHLASA